MRALKGCRRPSRVIRLALAHPSTKSNMLLVISTASSTHQSTKSSTLLALASFFFTASLVYHGGQSNFAASTLIIRQTVMCHAPAEREERARAGAGRGRWRRGWAEQQSERRLRGSSWRVGSVPVLRTAGGIAGHTRRVSFPGSRTSPATTR